MFYCVEKSERNRVCAAVEPSYFFGYHKGMFSENRMMPAPERQQEDELVTYDAFVSRDRLMAAVFDAVADANSRGDSVLLARRIRSLLGVEPSGRTAAIEEKIIGRFVEYDTFVERVAVERGRVLADIAAWMDKNEVFSSRRLDEVGVLCVDPLFDAAMRYKKESAAPWNFVGGEFDPMHNAIYLSHDEKISEPGALRALVAHEFGHALSHDVKTNSAGFRRIESDGSIEGNAWLDEGAAVIFEKEFQQEPDGARALKDPLYDGYAWVTNALLAKIGATQRELLDAWISGGDARRKFEEKIQTMFGCGSGDLSGLFMGFDDKSKKKMADVLDGERVVLEAVRGSGIDVAYEKIQAVFPAVVVRVVDPPAIAD